MCRMDKRLTFLVKMVKTRQLLTVYRNYIQNGLATSSSGRSGGKLSIKRDIFTSNKIPGCPRRKHPTASSFDSIAADVWCVAVCIMKIYLFDFILAWAQKSCLTCCIRGQSWFVWYNVRVHKCLDYIHQGEEGTFGGVDGFICDSPYNPPWLEEAANSEHRRIHSER